MLVSANVANTNPSEEEVTDKILTPANLISFVRLLLVPVYLFLLFNGQDIAALVVFSVAAATDFLDGQVARRTHTVSKLGRILDPAIDTILMLTGVLAIVLIGRLPVWIAVLVILREVYLLVGGGILLKKCAIRIPVIYPGKFATTFLFVGFAGMLLNLPIIGGLGICDITWLPGLNAEPCIAWIWLIYIGLVMQIGVTIYYSVQAWRKLQAYLSEKGDC